MVDRTTLRLDPQLLQAAKVRAAEEGTTFTAIVERALRRLLNQPPVEKPRARIPVRIYGAGGPAPGVNIEDNAAVRALLDEGADADSRR